MRERGLLCVVVVLRAAVVVRVVGTVVRGRVGVVLQEQGGDARGRRGLAR